MEHGCAHSELTSSTTVCQVKGLDGIIEGGGTIIGGTSGVGQGTRVNGGNWAILIVDIGSKLSILGPFAMSMGLLTTMAAVTTLSLGRSISAATAVGPALLLLLGKLGVHLLVLHSTKFVGLRGLAASTVGHALLLERESRRLDDTIGFQSLDFTGQGLTQNLCYDLHSRRELAENDHGLHIRRKLEASVFEVGEVAEHFRNGGSRMGASRDGRRQELTKFSIGRAVEYKLLLWFIY